ncbi:hypothetical protein PSTT_01768 [Puccinia striiformis]|uniref:Uncharacterized protein n=1 Tax=Puccinia striiformis TaxID=27350 RepID=A0A2S4W2M0_9BASI|nr:hypothetical protein PSTT_01768 [Puccinia striiformis]
MRFSSFLTIVALLFVQSEATHSTFICTDKSKPEAKVGYCLRRINKDQDHHNKDLPPLYKKDFLVILASPAPKGPKFTCAKLDIANKPVEARFCCHFPPVSPTPPKVRLESQLVLMSREIFTLWDNVYIKVLILTSLFAPVSSLYPSRYR